MFSRRSFDATKAFEKVTVFLKWYTDSKIGELTMEKEPKANLIMQKCIPHSVTNGCDNDGNPVYIELTGKIQCALLAANISKEDFINCHSWGMQQMLAKANESAKKTGKPIRKITMITDLQDIGFSHRAGLPYISATMSHDDLYYPKFVGKIYIVNGGYLFPLVWSTLKPYMPQWIIDSVEVVGDAKTEMPKYFPKETLPPEYGGSGAEIKVLDTSDLKSAAATTYDGEELTEENIAAGDKLEITIDAENRAGTFGWYFISEGDYDIGFSVSVEEKDGTVVEARKYDKLITDKGTYTSKGPCKVTLTWDNSYSFLTSKTIKFYASVAEVNNAQ
uniref:CRAL-TRIO domain-containing protein n=1 Tax=Lotharella globosa TaxID=91324 RepID=A0A7S3YE65_9EUKA